MKERINDLTIMFANANGTGSASSNALVARSIFRMGIPVSAKNIFPSNIQGLPTWYQIRANGEGHTGRSDEVDLMVAMNPQTYAQDVKRVQAGGYLVYDSTWPLDPALKRSDIEILGVPLALLCAKEFENVKTRILMKNVAYVGAVAALLDIEIPTIKKQLEDMFEDKPKLIPGNIKALEIGFNYAKEKFKCPLPIKLKRLNLTSDHILIDGNTASALGCVYAGATVGAWYPITPSTSLMDAFTGFCHQYRVDKKTKKNNYIVIQAEDELAAIGMVLGASWAGARAFTPTSGPGISLMNEFIGFAYYTEIPAVIFNVQRTGPSTGMPTRTQQADILLCAFASHGDTKHILLFPSSPEECFYFAVEAFDLAEGFQTPVFVLSDLDIGMNEWMCRKLKWNEAYKPNRGKILSAEQLEKMEAFYRYLDVDGDHIPYRTRPGDHPKGAYFTRGSGHDKFGRYTEDAQPYQEVVDRLKKKVDSSSAKAPKAIVEERSGATAAIVTLGGCDLAAREAIARLGRDGKALSYMRIRSFPFGQEVHDFIAKHEKIYVVEQNRDGQLRSLLVLETSAPKEKLVSILDYSGLPAESVKIASMIQEAWA